MSNRTDIHSPLNLVTENYDLVATFDNAENMSSRPAKYIDWRNGIFSKVYASNDERGVSQCHHCGARVRYIAVLEHKPTGEYIVVGEQCLDNRFSLATSQFHALRKAAELDRQAQRIRKLVAEFVEANPDLAWMNNKPGEALKNALPEASRDNGFIYDVARKLFLYGELSERQVSAVRAAIVRDVERAAERAAREAKVAEVETAPVITGRIVITGMVLSTKVQYGDYGTTLKMLVLDDRGFKVWGTVPSSIDVKRDDRIRFTATVEASDNDECFGFFKRPSKAEVLVVAPVAS